MSNHFRVLLFTLVITGSMSTYSTVRAQDTLPRDNGLWDYYTAPEWRESEGHPLRLAAYLVHPVGWVLREAVARPVSYVASSTEFTRSFFGYRYPFDYRTPECFSASDTTPDCRSLAPFNYTAPVDQELSMGASGGNESAGASVYFPNVNFDFDKRGLNQLGKGMAGRIAAMLKKDAGVKVVLQGHADYIGSDQYNDTLGLDRANAVREELLTLGVAPERISTVSFGETMPLIDEQTDAARAVNRRVEVHPDA